MTSPPPRLVAGCMTGTSIDSLDAALVEITGRGLEMKARFVRGVARPLGALTPRLRALAEQHPIAGSDIERLTRAIFPILTVAGGNDLAFLRLFLGCVRDNNAATNLLALLDTSHDDAVMKRLNIYCHH